MILQINVQAKMGGGGKCLFIPFGSGTEGLLQISIWQRRAGPACFQKYLAAKTGTYLHRKHRSDNHAFAIICDEKKSFH